jgi:MFS family permease
MPSLIDKQTPNNPRFFYGWIIVAVSALILLVVFGIRLSFTVFFVALTEEFAWPRADTALIFSISMIVFAIASTPAGIALDKYGARKTFSVGIGFLALGLLLSSQVSDRWQLALTYGVIAGLGITILGLGPQAGLIARWFRRNRGVAIGIAFAGTGLGTLLLTPAVERLISQFDWRFAYVFLSVLVIALIPIIVTFLRLNPSDKNLHPDGDSGPASNNQNQLGEEWTLARAAKTSAFWLVIVASLFAIGPLRMLTVHQLAAMVDAGFDLQVAARFIGASGLVTAAAFIIFGAFSDRKGRRAAYAIGSLCLLGAIVILSGLSAGQSNGMLLIYALLLGLGEGSRSSLITAVASDLFHGPSLGAINGAVGAAFGLGAAIFPWMAGYIFDQTGFYSSAFAIAGVSIVISTLALWLAPVVKVRRFSQELS